jgi:outer membrane receptor protein involved in Fe transport
LHSYTAATPLRRLPTSAIVTPHFEDDWLKTLFCAAFGLMAANALRIAYAAAPDPGPPVATDDLEPIVVTAQKAATGRLIDRRVYDMTRDLQSITGTAADILNDIPSVEVDADGIVSLRGDSNVLILIDGKPSAQLTGAAAADGLFQLPASEIARVEILTTPPAEFKAAGAAGIINIVTKKPPATGSSRSLLASVGNDERYVLAATANQSSGPLNLFGGLGLREDDRRRILTDYRAAIDPATQNLVLSQESVDEHVRRLTPSIKAGLDYRIDEDRSFGFTVSRRERFGDRQFDQYDESALPAAAPSAVSNRYSAGTEWRLDNDAKLQFDQELARPEEALSFTLQRSLVSEREHYDYTNTYSLPVQVPSYDDLNLSLDLATTEFSIDYSLPLAGGLSLKLGADLEQDDDDFGNSGDTIDPLTGARTLNPDITNYFRYEQKIDSLYGSYQWAGKTWTLLAGLRVERTSGTFPPQATALDVIGHSYAGAYPSLHWDRSLSGASTLSLSIGRRITRPDPEFLDPYIDRQDTQNLRAGNPNLRPEDTRSAELGYSFDSKHNLSYSVTGYLRRNRDSVIDVTQVVSATVVLTTKQNLPKDTAEGLEFSIDGHLGSRLSFGLSGNLFHDEIDATSLAQTGLKVTTGLNAKANLDYHPTSADTAQLSFTRSDKRLTPQGYISAIDLLNLGFKHQIRTNLAGVLTVSDVFNGQILRRFVGTPELSDRYERAQVGRISYVGIVYSFGAPKKTKSGFDYIE